jgi:DNA recombination protein RmuC
VSLALAVLAAALCGAAAAAAAFYLVFFSARKNGEAERAGLKEDLRSLLELSEQKLETERVRRSAELEEKKQAVESAVSRLSEQLKAYEALVRQFEAERGQKYGSLEERLRETTETTGRLAASTEGLRQLLDNSRARGQWGERMADDILRASGLQENVQYLKNRAQETSASRPDFTFLLPEGHKLHMDVKFPLDNYLRMANAAADGERERFKGDFLKDVKARVRELQKRDYINPAEQTLDYVLLFIPNEQVYGFIHEAFPGLVDEALSQKVVLCSPFSLYALLGVVRQAFDNFHFAQASQEVLKLVSAFAGAYGRFRERFAELGERLDKAAELYRDISDKSFRQLEASVAKIDRARKGEEEEPALPLPAAKAPGS